MNITKKELMNFIKKELLNFIKKELYKNVGLVAAFCNWHRLIRCFVIQCITRFKLHGILFVCVGLKAALGNWFLMIGCFVIQCITELGMIPKHDME